MSFKFNGLFQDTDADVEVIDPLILSFADNAKMGAYQANIWNRLMAFKKAISNDRFKIASRTRSNLSGKVGDGAAGGWDNSATTDLPIQSAYMNAVILGSVLKVGSEIVVVKAVDRANNTIDVDARGAGSTSAATHADGDAFSIIGSATQDTDLKNLDSRGEETLEYENYMQLALEVVEWTFSSETEARKYFEIAPQFTKEAADRVFQQLARMVILGVKRGKGADQRAMTGGLLDQLADSTAGSKTRDLLRLDAGGAFTQSVLNAALDQVLNTGMPNAIYVSKTNHDIISGFDHAVSSQVVLGTGESILTRRNVGGYATKYDYNGHVFDIVRDQDIPDDRVPIVTEDEFRRGFKENDPLRFVVEPASSSREFKVSLQGKVGVSLEGVGRDHIDIHGIT